MKQQEKIGRAIGTISEFLHQTAEDYRIGDPLDERNNALRELVVRYLEFHFRRKFFPNSLADAFSSDSTAIIQLLERACVAHQRFMEQMDGS